jgi:hypothetical protein
MPGFHDKYKSGKSWFTKISPYFKPFKEPATQLIKDKIKPYVPQGPSVLDPFKDPAREVFENLKGTYF